MSWMKKNFSLHAQELLLWGRKNRAAICDADVSHVLEYESAFKEKCKTVSDYMSILQNGTEMTKIHSRRRWRERKLILNVEELKVYYRHTFKRCHRPDYEIDLIDIHEVRRGWKTDTFNRVESKIEKFKKRNEENCENKKKSMPKKYESIDESSCFSIIYGVDRKSLDLAAKTSEMAETWCIALRHMVSVLKELEHLEKYSRWLKNQFESADSDKSGALNFDECCKLLLQLNVQLENEEAKRLFDKANTRQLAIKGEQVLDVDEFVEFFFLLMSRPDIEELFKGYTYNAQEMDSTQLGKFLEKEQKVKCVTPEMCWNLIATFEASDLKKKGRISLIGFTHLLLSEQSKIFNSEHNVVYQDMNHPLAHYYIASSHNTYLTGGQLNGESSVEGYIQALKSGCRCVELDCWDGPEGEPIVYHGYTLTSKILLRDVLTDAIRTNAFIASEYPVILSIENHCTESQEKRIVEHLKKILKDMLYLEPIDESIECLPSPEELKRKIIVKAKKMKISADEDSGNDDDEVPSNDEEQNQPEKPVNNHLSNLVNICQAVHFHGFKHTHEAKCYQMSSFSESKAEKLIRNERENFILYNSKQLSRIYPSGTRTESSNFKPVPFWNVGCQIVALNYQNFDKSTFINAVKFKQNGNCGYVLKPEYLYNPEMKRIEECQNKLILQLKIISGQYIPKPHQSLKGEVIDPYVKAEILGHEADKAKFKTKPVKNNGFNPLWNSEMKFILNMPDLAILMLTVKDFSSSGVNKKLGAYAIPVTSINAGYRHVYLMDYSGQHLTPSSLFIHISFLKE